MVLSTLPVPGRPTYLEKSRARACCSCSRCGWGLFGHFSLVYHLSCLSSSLWETARYRLEYCLKGPVSQKQPTNKIKSSFKSRNYIQNEKRGPYFEVSAIQASSVTLI